MTPKHPLVVAHRGWPSRFPDNTLAGVVAASSIADVVEIDVRRSADGKLVLAHDPSIGGCDVASNPWRVLSELDVGGGHHPALLDEVLAAIPNTPTQLEVKNFPGEPGFEPDHRLALETASRARPFDMVTCFNAASLEAVRRDFDDVATGFVVGFATDLRQAASYCRDAGHCALVPAAGLVAGPVEALVGEGVEVYPWVVDDAGVARELVEAGVSGIITDEPGVIALAIRGDQ